MEQEIWKDIPGYEDLHQVSSLGRVKHLSTQQSSGTGRYARQESICTPHLMNNGYLVVDLYKNNRRKTMLVHRLVALAFIPNPSNFPCVNHLDSNRANPNVENLEWCTVSHNHKYSYDTNNRREKMNWKQGKDNKKSKAVLMLDKVSGEILRRFDSIKDVERELNIFNSSICSCLKGRYKTAGGYKWIYAE